MSHFPSSKQKKATCNPTIIWCCNLVLDENAIMRGEKNPNEHVCLSLREVLGKIFPHRRWLRKSLHKTSCSQLPPQCSLQNHPCQSKAVGGRKMNSGMFNHLHDLYFSLRVVKKACAVLTQAKGLCRQADVQKKEQ